MNYMASLFYFKDFRISDLRQIHPNVDEHIETLIDDGIYIQNSFRLPPSKIRTKVNTPQINKQQRLMKSIYFLSLLILARATGLYSQYYPLAEEIVSSMSLDQKIGQTTQVDYAYLNDQGQTRYEKIRSYMLGSVLVGGNGCPDKNGNVSMNDLCFDATNAAWRKVADKSFEQFIVVNTADGEVHIKPLLGTDAVHGNQHAVGELLWPHNIGLAASHNPENFKNAGYWNKVSLLKSGFNFAFAPTVAVSHNPKWGRFYETMGTDPTQIKKYAKEYVAAIQDADGQHLNGVLASTKHFFGDGATFNGNDEGNVHVNDFQNFYNRNIQGYLGALEVNTGNIMISYSAINELPMHISTAINAELKNKLGFDGFVISDYNAILKVAFQGLPTTTTKMAIDEAYALTFNNGMDMIMISDNVEGYQGLLKQLINENRIPVSRLDDAVKRILAVKLAMRLVDVPKQLASKYGYSGEKKESQTFLGQEVKADINEYAQALKAGQESLVLLKNKLNVLPLSKKIVNVVLVGDRIINIRNKGEYIFSDFDNIGAQNGGWTVRWQGYLGNDYWKGDFKISSRATSILDAIKAKYSASNIYYASYSVPNNLEIVQKERAAFRDQLVRLLPTFSAENTVVIHVLSESPYAEFAGDIDCVYCYKETSQEGCLYNAKVNEYLADEQSRTLEIDFSDYSNTIVNLLHQGDPDIPVVTVLFSGRPMIINKALAKSSAFIAAWLPGTTGGEAVVSSIVGDYLFRSNGISNVLPVPWIQTMESLQGFPVYDSVVPKIKNVLFDEGYGLETQPKTLEDQFD